MSAPIRKNRAKDHRPKVISFHQTLDGLDIAAKRSVLWPCHAFNISIPQKKKSALNVFEETVLKITEVESGDTQKITEITCLEKELVIFIQNRLNQLGLLNDRYELAEEGKKLLESWRNKDEANIEYVAGTVFVDLHSGKLLSYIHIGELKQEKIKSIEESFVNVELGSTGKSKSTQCRLISPNKDSHWNITPDSSGIIRAIRAFKKKYKNRALLTQGVDQYSPSVPMAEAITVNDSPELVYLHCEIFIQTGNSDLLVTDGYGFGFSEIFANYLTSQNWKWVTKLKRKGVIDNIDNEEGGGNHTTRKSFKYSQISKPISRSKSSLEKIKKLKINSTYYESDYRQEIEHGIKNLYVALEWSLREVVTDNPVTEWKQMFSASTSCDIEKLLVGFAKKVGFSVNEENQHLLQVKPGAIRHIKNDMVVLQPLLALAIAGANSNANHPVHRLALNHSSFLAHALRLKRYRDPIEHGSTEKLNVDDKILEDLIDATVPMLISLVPGVAGDLGEVDQSYSDTDVNQERLKANIALEKSLGTAFVSEMSSDVKEQLIRAELMLAKYTDEVAIEIIKCYASVMQHILFDAVSDRGADYPNDKFNEYAIEKIVLYGFYPSSDAIPKEITKAVLKRTLGSALLAIFLMGSKNELIEIQKSAPKFVDFVANLIRLRGHGNKQQSGFSRDDMESLKNNVFEAIKIITEVF